MSYYNKKPTIKFFKNIEAFLTVLGLYHPKNVSSSNLITTSYIENYKDTVIDTQEERMEKDGEHSRQEHI